MQVPNILTEKKSILIEVIILCVFLGALFYGYTLISEKSPITTVSTTQPLFGPNMTLLLKALNEDHIVLNNRSFMTGQIARQLEDFSEVILPSIKRGRDNPFSPN